MLEYPQYTRPQIWRDREVPPVLLSGHHENVDKWKREQSVLNTAKKRPDMLKNAELSDSEKELVKSILQDKNSDCD